MTQSFSNVLQVCRLFYYYFLEGGLKDVQTLTLKVQLLVHLTPVCTSKVPRGFFTAGGPACKGTPAAWCK